MELSQYPKIGVLYSKLEFVDEVFQLLKVPWEPYNSNHYYDVVIAHKSNIPEYTGNIINLGDDDIFLNIINILNNFTSDPSIPKCDELLMELRNKLQNYTRLIEIPPSPWDHPYMVALTHDVDFISIKECKLRTVGYAVFKCFKQFKFISGLKLICAKFKFGSDPWDLFKTWENMETFFDVRSTFFFAPKKGCGLKSHPHREINYNLDKNLLNYLTTNGWEIGVHGIDNWLNSEYGTEELKLLSQQNSGNRTHWLMFNNSSLSTLDSAGYFYDSTIGYNHTVGFKSGTLQVYKPLQSKNLLELPIHIQDIGLLGDYCWEIDSDVWKKIHCLNFDNNSAIELCEKMFHQANYYGGVLTISWHYHNITYPKDWSYIYTYIIQSTKYIDNAWATTAKNIVDWFKQRRNVIINTYEDANKINIHLDNYIPSKLPLLKLRIYINPIYIKSVNSEYISTDTYIDIKCDKSTIEVELQ